MGPWQNDRRADHALQCRERGALSGIEMAAAWIEASLALQCRERGALSGIGPALLDVVCQVVPSM